MWDGVSGEGLCGSTLQACEERSSGQQESDTQHPGQSGSRETQQAAWPSAPVGPEKVDAWGGASARLVETSQLEKARFWWLDSVGLGTFPSPTSAKCTFERGQQAFLLLPHHLPSSQPSFLPSALFCERARLLARSVHQRLTFQAPLL